MATVSVDDRTTIADGIYEFYSLVDGGQAARTEKLFTADARLTFGPGSPKPGSLEGHDAIAAAMAAREAQTSAFTRHVVTNITYQGSLDSIGVHYLLTLFRSDDETRDSRPAFVADVDERWVEKSGNWLIAERTILPAFARA